MLTAQRTGRRARWCAVAKGMRDHSECRPTFNHTPRLKVLRRKLQLPTRVQSRRVSRASRVGTSSRALREGTGNTRSDRAADVPHRAALDPTGSRSRACRPRRGRHPLFPRRIATPCRRPHRREPCPTGCERGNQSIVLVILLIALRCTDHRRDPTHSRRREWEESRLRAVKQYEDHSGNQPTYGQERR